MKIAIFASVGAQNLWDELIVKNQVKIFNQWITFSSQNLTPQPPLLSGEVGQDEFHIFTYYVKHPFFWGENIFYHEYFPIDSKKITNLFRNLKNFLNFLKITFFSDVIVIGGGGIFYDFEGDNGSALRQWEFRTKIFRFFRKKIVFYGVSLDIRDTKNFEIIQRIFSKNSAVYVRDSFSQNFLKNLWIESEQVPDSVYFDNTAPSTKISSDIVRNPRSLQSKRIPVADFSLSHLKKYNFSGKKIGIALRKGFLGKSGSTSIEQGMIGETLKYIQEQGWEIILLPHSFHGVDVKSNDYEFLKQFLSHPSPSLAWKEGNKITSSMEETYKYYQEKKIDFCLSMRLHSMILCEVYGIEYLGLSYSRKTD